MEKCSTPFHIEQIRAEGITPHRSFDRRCTASGAGEHASRGAMPLLASQIRRQTSAFFALGSLIRGVLADCRSGGGRQEAGAKRLRAASLNRAEIDRKRIIIRVQIAAGSPIYSGVAN